MLSRLRLLAKASMSFPWGIRHYTYGVNAKSPRLGTRALTWGSIQLLWMCDFEGGRGDAEGALAVDIVEAVGVVDFHGGEVGCALLFGELDDRIDGVARPIDGVRTGGIAEPDVEALVGV